MLSEKISVDVFATSSTKERLDFKETGFNRFQDYGTFLVF